MKYQTQNGWTKESIIAHVKAEFKGKSVADDNSEQCLYRGPNGAKCAVGMFLSDDLYDPAMEGLGVQAGTFIDNNRILEELPLSLSLMMELQGIHDASHPDHTLKEILYWIEKNVE